MKPNTNIFTKAIVRKPCKNFIHGITSADLGKPDYKIALNQHNQYCDALRQCNLDVIVLPSDENYPDSTFVEDTAILTPSCAIITNPGAHSRKGEIADIKKVLQNFYENIEQVYPPGTSDGGDILESDGHYYIGLSDRTNIEGAEQIIDLLKNYGITASTVVVKNSLHLKSGIAYLGNRCIVVGNNFRNDSLFEDYKIIRLDDNESYAANCVNVNGKVIMPRGFKKAGEAVSSAGFSIIEVDVSEFQKLDGGVSCLSLRF